MFDVCVIGHVTRDIIRLPGRTRNEIPGGVVYYAGMALRSLGLETAVITKAAKDDADEITAELRQIGVRTYCSATEATTVFENDYSGGGIEIRDQRVRSVASAFDPRDLERLRARIFHLGPLTNGEMSVGFLTAVSRRGGRVFLDVQGFVRRIERRQVGLVDWRDKREGLDHVDVLKANLAEARILSGEDDPERAARAIADLGPTEVVVTLGGEGSLLLASGRVYRVPAFRGRGPWPIRRAVATATAPDTSFADCNRTMSRRPAGSAPPWRRSSYNALARSRATRERSARCLERPILFRTSKSRLNRHSTHP